MAKKVVMDDRGLAKEIADHWKKVQKEQGKSTIKKVVKKTKRK